MEVGRVRRELELIRSSVGVSSISTRSFGEPVTAGGGAALTTGGGVAALDAEADAVGSGIGATDATLGAEGGGCTGGVGCATGATATACGAGSGCVWQISRGKREAGKAAS